MENEKPLYQKIDYGLIIIMLALAAFSLVAIYQSAGPGTFLRQFIWYGVGTITLMVTLLVDYRRLKPLALPLYILGILLLVIVALFAEEKKGAKSWLDFGSFSFQPSEMMKIFLIIFIAYLITKAQEQFSQKSLRNDFKIVGQVAVISIIPFIMILVQPDLGTALVIFGIVAAMLLVAGISWRILFGLTALGIGAITGLVLLYFLNEDLFSLLIKQHQLSRFYGWLAPHEHASEAGYQLLQGIYSIGSGQLVGKQFDDQVVTSQWAWIPEVHTDFIFAVIGEQFGFIGSSILISLFFILIYRLVQIALTCNDPFGSYLVTGIVGYFVFQIFQNIGMTIGLMPITGITLPFISYGGSALLANMISMGIVLNVAMRTKEYMFD